jgi:ADP-ribose pyrophosphatase YjhB (NUDIX family)
MIQRIETGLWTLPGGKVEPGESWESCASRELEEETGVICKSANMLLAGVISYTEEKEYLGVFFHCLKHDGDTRFGDEMGGIVTKKGPEENPMAWFKQSKPPKMIPTAKAFMDKYPRIWSADVSNIRSLKCLFGTSKLD